MIISITFQKQVSSTFEWLLFLLFQQNVGASRYIEYPDPINISPHPTPTQTKTIVILPSLKKYGIDISSNHNIFIKRRKNPASVLCKTSYVSFSQQDRHKTNGRFENPLKASIGTPKHHKNLQYHCKGNGKL